MLCCVEAERGAFDRYGASEEVGTRERSDLKMCGIRLRDRVVQYGIEVSDGVLN